ncbi:CBS domain-containing protein [Acidianus sulfidivorans JP7]|uniref:CBS domain-containing protein n=1 Tax=Acidianus sulfidivorans JP7 TaxID=619593 RepID=A0A2U9ILN4_9CREN|nr:CBS domain-containing protein [Acidianus sulfidivorans]AWR96824.1 CBS domain-containing protein [Acidianus sulfidivorans JP7]
MSSKKSLDSYLISENSSLEEVIKKMKYNEFLILVDKFKKPLGFITRDYLKKIDNKQFNLEKIACKTILTIRGDEEPIELLNLMIKNKIRFLIRTQYGKIKEIITIKDVLKQVEEQTKF